MATEDQKQHLSMLKSLHLADVVTLCNAACGTLSIFSSVSYVAASALHEADASIKFWLACAFVPLGLFFDILDGRVARWRQKSSAMGRELDSLSDIISFGVAPAVLGFAAGLREIWHVVVLLFFVCCGVSRLARYNITAEEISVNSGKGKVTYFEGAPTPTSVCLVALLAIAHGLDRLGDQLLFGQTAFCFLYALLGCSMVSKTLKIPKP